MSDYVTVKKEASGEFTEKRSRFIGHIKSVATREEAEEFISGIKSKYWDARHNVYAYVLRDGNIQKYSDDSEPQGTAGVPVLQVIQKESLSDCVIVVTRYFGGILLGTGGLTRAYGKAAKLAVEAGGKKKMAFCDEMEIICDYSLYGKLPSLFASFGAITLDEAFSDSVKVTFAVRQPETQKFQKELTELSAGKVTAIQKSRGYYEEK